MAPTENPSGPAVGGSAAPSPGTTYLPHLDGLRTVAVYLVVVFHAGIGRFSGGFIGVDVFFVLSGYLVTRVLLSDLSRHGSIDLSRFYARRIRRLLPASALLLAATAVAYPVLIASGGAAEVSGSLQASALYYANWSLIAQASDYFAPAVEQSPVLHFWSLAVEEQFYIIWPLCFGGLHLVTRRSGGAQLPMIRLAVAGGAALSVGTALWVTRTDEATAYYGTHTRAYQLLAGVLLALSPGVVDRVRRWGGRGRILGLADGCGLLALVLVATRHLDAPDVQRGVITTVLTVGLLVTLEAGGDGLVKRGLSTAPMVYLGRISYGTYLWHWLIVLVLLNEFDLSGVGVAAFTIVVATGIASLSYQLLEMPIRSWKRLDGRGPAVVVVGLVISATLGFVVLPRLLAAGERSTETRALVGEDPASSASLTVDEIDWRFASGDAVPFSSCANDGPEACVVRRGSGPSVLLLGDSHALALSPMVGKLAEERDLSFALVTSPGCPWAEGLVDQDPRAGGCADRRAEWYTKIVPALDPDLVILAGRPLDDPSNPVSLADVDAGELRAGTEAWSTAVARRSEATVDLLVGQGRTVLILEPIPVAPEGMEVPTCLSRAETIEECRFVTHTDPTAAERAFRTLDGGSPDVVSADLDRLVCPYLPICDPTVGRVVVFRDDIHLTKTFAESLADPFGELLDRAGLLSG